MRILLSSVCRCCFPLEEDPKETAETVIKEDPPLQKSIPTESPFQVKEIRQRSVDYVVHSPRFGSISLPDCTGGTDSSIKKPSPLYKAALK